ncbi:MAG: glycosyltransferase [Alphaproteobacteria bacterium]|nr:glycosyltransferase [Alphaproteobacteria bacterium]
MNKDIRVSVILITYNSSLYIIEALESIKNQSYRDFELIISDDCSSDNTCYLIEQWLVTNRSFFKNVILICSDHNLGIVKNCNRGLDIAKGQWIKMLAGDDLLLPDCIANNISFINKFPDTKFLFSGALFIKETNESIQSFELMKSKQKYYFELSPKSQFRQLIKYNFVFAPTAFINNQVLKNIGRFDETFRNIEDYPLWIKATRSGYKLDYLEMDTVAYRIHSNTIAAQGYSYKLKNDLFNIFYKLLLPELSLNNALYLLDTYLNISASIYNINFIRYFSPLYLLNLFKLKLGKKD